MNKKPHKIKIKMLIIIIKYYKASEKLWDWDFSFASHMWAETGAHRIIMYTI